VGLRAGLNVLEKITIFRSCRHSNPGPTNPQPTRYADRTTLTTQKTTILESTAVTTTNLMIPHSYSRMYVTRHNGTEKFLPWHSGDVG
jgi:hypothetical protein